MKKARLMKYAFLVASLLVLTGCGREKKADIATTEQMKNKTLIFILPSIPEQFCYSNQMAEVTEELASKDLNASNPQTLSIDSNIDCSYFGFTNCQRVDMGVGEDNKEHSFIECLSDTQDRLCLYLIGNEYRDVDGNTFDETCVQGYDSKPQGANL